MMAEKALIISIITAKINKYQKQIREGKVKETEVCLLMGKIEGLEEAKDIIN